jgi:hypothetical protein
MSPNASAKPPKPSGPAPRAPGGAEARRRIDAGVAELVVRRALARIGEDLVGLLGLLELVLGGGALLVRIAVRMVLHRELAVRLLDVVFDASRLTPSTV